MKRWKEVNTSLQVYIAIVSVLGVVIFVIGIVWSFLHYANLLLIILFIFLLTILASSFKLKVFENNYLAMTTPVYLASAILLPWQIAAMPIFLGTLIIEHRETRTLYVSLFNSANVSISTFLASLFIGKFLSFEHFFSLEFFLIAGVASLLLVTTNNLLVALAISFQKGFRILDVLKSATEFNVIFPTLATLIAALILVHSIFTENYLLLLAILITFGLLVSTLKREETIRENRKAAIKSLVETIGARDKYTKDHCIRVAELSKDIAKELKLSFRDIELVEYAGMLHDLGKISFPDEAFTKKRLDHNTWELIRSHPETAGKILEGMHEMDIVTGYIELHHEKINGTGYPRGLKDRQIPLISRILAVSDTFDAMTSDRAYRRAFPPEVAIHEIVSFKGESFDPRVVDAFLKVIKLQHGINTDINSLDVVNN